MPQKTEHLINSVVGRIDAVAVAIEAITASLFERWVRLPEQAYRMAVNVTLRVRDGASRLTTVLRKLFLASLKLSGLYSPCLLFFLGGFWKLFGLLWFLLAIVLSFMNKNSGGSGVVRCPKCQQQLRVRIFKDIVTTRCPACSHEFKIKKRSADTAPLEG